MRERLNAKLRQVKATLRGMMHLPIPEQGRYLRLARRDRGKGCHQALGAAPAALSFRRASVFEFASR